jgi:hypothetical protein
VTDRIVPKGYYYSTSIRPEPLALHYALPSFEASSNYKYEYLSQAFPRNEIARFNKDHLFAYYCASMVQFQRGSDRWRFLNDYARLDGRLQRNQVDLAYFDILTPPQNNTVIFNAVGQINIAVIRDFLQMKRGLKISNSLAHDFCSRLLNTGDRQNYCDSEAVLRNFEIYKEVQQLRELTADDLLMFIACDVPDEEIVVAARKLQHLDGDFTEAIDAAIGEERKLEPDEKVHLACLLDTGIVSRRALAAPLLSAISAGQSYRLARILNHAPDISGLTVADFHAAFAACPKNRSHIVTALLMAGGANKLNEKDPSTGDSLIHVAARLGDLELVQLLIDWEADPKVPNLQGKMALDFLEPEQLKRLSFKSSD